MKRRINKNHQKLIFAGLFLVTAVIVCWLKWPKPSHPDIILITVDALRADHLSAYGYSRKTSPNIDNLAKEGEIFLNCSAVSSKTVCSIPGLFTGRYLAVNKGESFWVNVFDEKFATLQRYLKGFGYFTAALVGNIHIKESKGFTKDFDLFYFNNNGENSGYKLTVEAMKLLNSRRKNKPIFIWLHYMDAHVPYYPLEEYLKIFEKDVLFKENDKILCLRPDNLNSSPYSSDGYLPRAAYCEGKLSLNHYIARYDAGILSADFCIGNLLNNIKKDTIVILTADHGESLGEHNRYFTHGENIYEGVLHIPLILRDNKNFTGGKKISEPVSAVDIVPTILSRIDPLWYFFNSKKFNGIDLRQVYPQGVYLFILSLGMEYKGYR